MREPENRRCIWVVDSPRSHKSASVARSSRSVHADPLRLRATGADVKSPIGYRPGEDDGDRIRRPARNGERWAMSRSKRNVTRITAAAKWGRLPPGGGAGCRGPLLPQHPAALPREGAPDRLAAPGWPPRPHRSAQKAVRPPDSPVTPEAVGQRVHPPRPEGARPGAQRRAAHNVGDAPKAALSGFFSWDNPALPLRIPPARPERDCPAFPVRAPRGSHKENGAAAAEPPGRALTAPDLAILPPLAIPRSRR